MRKIEKAAADLGLPLSFIHEMIVEDHAQVYFPEKKRRLELMLSTQTTRKLQRIASKLKISVEAVVVTLLRRGIL